MCVSVTALATSVSAYIRKQRYTRVDFSFFLDFDSWIFKKNLPFESYGVKKPIANKLELTASRFRILRDQRNTAAT